jgi:hypothetical protein
MCASAPDTGNDPDLTGFARRFVRDRLGCGCPEALLARMEIDPLPELTRLRVGGRLLVHIRICPGPDTLPHLLAGWLADGVAQRDAQGFNRFRLVLATDDEAAVRPVAEALFATLDGDDRRHLHLVQHTELDCLLPPADA